jgi:hypothetical protein
VIGRKPVVQLCYEARKRLLFVLWDGIVFKDILYQMGRIRDTFIYGAAVHELPGGGNTGAWVWRSVHHPDDYIIKI